MFKRYSIRLVGRIIVLLFAVGVYFFYPALEEDLLSTNILDLTILDIFWAAMFTVIIVVFAKRPNISIGSIKFRRKFYQASGITLDKERIKKEKRQLNIGAWKVVGGWILLNAFFAVLYIFDIIGVKEMFILSMLYYVGDLVCVVLFCPFQRVLMKNRCCVTCRIFNWAPLMMVTPLFFIPGIFSWTLCIAAIIVFITWEYSYHKYPERFLPQTNLKLNCSNCTDKVCKIRKPLTK